MDYPAASEEWDGYDGIILPGSFSDAYGNEEWIASLKDAIRNEIVGKRRRCLGVCFGHQVLAHSFGESDDDDDDGGDEGEKEEEEEESIDAEDRGDEKKAEERVEEDSDPDLPLSDDCRGGGGGGEGGRACPCPAGFQFGRHEFELTPEGSALLFPPSSSSSVDDGGRAVPPAAFANGNAGAAKKERRGGGGGVQLLYTHGDMVRSLPPCAVSLGGTRGTVPIQSAAYFESKEEADRFRRCVVAENGGAGAEAALTTTTTTTTAARAADEEVPPPPIPYAFTFQAHPEYKSRGYGRRTFVDIGEKLRGGMKGRLPPDDFVPDERREDALRHWDVAERDSLAVTVAVGRWLGWFP